MDGVNFGIEWISILRYFEDMFMFSEEVLDMISLDHLDLHMV